ncbi:hypothetical protein [Pseudarthrobacter sp. S6]|uniref:hypothetical protein n=1 Tax=Pseudarthrobacter sp. S6 TaxID=3418420 RepID=UPI003CF76CC2
MTHEGPERLSHHVSISVLTGVFPPDVVEKVLALVSAGLYEEVRDPWSPGWNGSRAGGLSEGGHAELGRVAALGDLVHFGKFGAGPCEADFEAFGFSEPAVGLGFGDALNEVIADLCQTGSGRGIGPQQRAAQAAVLVDAVRVVGAAAITDGNSLGTAYDETRNGPSPLPSKR